MKTTRTFLFCNSIQEDSTDIYSRNKNILNFLERLNKIKFRESQYFHKKEYMKLELDKIKKHKKNSKSIPLSISISINKINFS